MQPNQQKKAERERLWEELGPEKYAKDCLGIGPSQYKKYRKAFSLIDAGGEGTVTKKEFIFMLDKFQLGTALSKAEVNDLFDRLDRGGSKNSELSGEIDFKEFLDSLDKNNLDKSLAGIIPAILSKEEIIEKEVKKIKKTLKTKKSQTTDKTPTSGEKTPKSFEKLSQRIMDETGVSRDEYKKYKKVFKTIKKPEKESFDKTDFRNALKVYFIWQNCPGEYIDEVYDKFSKDENGNVDLFNFIKSLQNKDNKEFIIWINILNYILEKDEIGSNTEKLIKEASDLFVIDIEGLKEEIKQRDAELEDFRRKEAQYLKDLEESNENEKLSFQEKLGLFNKNFKGSTMVKNGKVKVEKNNEELNSREESTQVKNEKVKVEETNEELAETITSLRKELEDTIKGVTALREELTKVKSEKTKIEETNQDLTGTIAKLRKELEDFSKSSLGVGREVATLREEMAKVKNEKAKVEEANEELTRTITSLKQQLEDFSKNNQDVDKRVIALREELTNIKNEKTKVEETNDGLNGTIAGLRQQLGDFSKSSLDLGKEVTALREEVIKAKSEKTKVEKANEELTRTIVSLRKEFEDFSKNGQDADKGVTALRGELSKANSEKAKVEEANEELTRTISSLRLQLKDFSKSNQGEDKEIAALREELTKISNEKVKIEEVNEELTGTIASLRQQLPEQGFPTFLGGPLFWPFGINIFRFFNASS